VDHEARQHTHTHTHTHARTHTLDGVGGVPGGGAGGQEGDGGGGGASRSAGTDSDREREEEADEEESGNEGMEEWWGKFDISGAARRALAILGEKNVWTHTHGVGGGVSADSADSTRGLRILSVDGGGVKGIVAVRLLARLGAPVFVL
jgi:hypothetical protein